MNSYEHHIGDYARGTAHLTMLEDGALRRLLDRYYCTEQGIPAVQAHRIARAHADAEVAAVDTVLREEMAARRQGVQARWRPLQLHGRRLVSTEPGRG